MADLMTLGVFLAGGLLGSLLGGAAGYGMARARHHGLVPRADLDAARSAMLVLETRLAERDQKHKEDMQSRLSDVNALQEKMQLSFESLSHRIFDSKTSAFKQQSKESLGELLNPLREQLEGFHKKVDDSFGNHGKEQFALKEEIKRIVETHDRMTATTDNLSKALRGDSRVQGNWGEIMLEKILADSGLRPNIDYVLQGVDFGMKHLDTGQAQKPDVVVMVPPDKHIIIDAKVSLTHYERYCAAQDDAASADALKGFLASVRTHITGLEARRYQDTDRLGTPDFVFMFMPIEGAFALALQQDQALQGFAWDKKIVLVCPSTLFACLRTVASLWKIDMQAKNHEEIARTGGELYDKIAGFVTEFEKIGVQVGRIGETYDGAFKKLTGHGSIIRKAEKLRLLGAKTSKKINKVALQDDEDEDIEPMLKIVSE